MSEQWSHPWNALHNKGADNLIIPHIACDTEISGCNVGSSELFGDFKCYEG